MEDAHVVELDVCRFGCLDKKPMQAVTNAAGIARRLSKRRANNARHVAAYNGLRLRDAASWMFTICFGIKVSITDHMEEFLKHDSCVRARDEHNDEIADEKLHKSKVTEAPRDDWEYFEAMGVHDTVLYTHTRKTKENHLEPIG